MGQRVLCVRDLCTHRHINDKFNQIWCQRVLTMTIGVSDNDTIRMNSDYVALMHSTETIPLILTDGVDGRWRIHEFIACLYHRDGDFTNEKERIWNTVCFIGVDDCSVDLLNDLSAIREDTGLNFLHRPAWSVEVDFLASHHSTPGWCDGQLWKKLRNDMLSYIGECSGIYRLNRPI